MKVIYMSDSNLIGHIHKLVLIYTDNKVSNIDWLNTAMSGHSNIYLMLFIPAYLVINTCYPV